MISSQISFPQEMRFKKTFFPTNLWGGEKVRLDKFSSKTTPLKLRG